jgi:hypothetical protein
MISATLIVFAGDGGCLIVGMPKSVFGEFATKKRR